MKKLTAWLLLAVCLTAALFGCGTGRGTTAEKEKTETTAETEALETAAETKAAEEGTEEAEESSGETGEAEKETIRVGGLKGPTTMGMVKLLADAENGSSALSVEFTMAAGADELTPKLLKGDLDMIAAPANLGAVLYNNSEGAVKFAAVNTLGVLYIVEKGNGELSSLSDLKGKTIYATGKGSTPEYTLTYLLSENGLDPETDVTIEWKSEPTEVVSLLANQESGVAMLPQPFATVAQGQLEGLSAAFDLTEEWKKLENGSMLITAGLIVRKEFAEAHPEALAEFLKEYKASTEYLNENLEEGAALVEKYGIVKATVAEKAIPACNITYIDGEEMKTALSGYLEILYGQNPKAVGGALPGEEFYLP